MTSLSSSSRLDILAVKMAVARYKKVAGAKVKFDNSEGLQLGAWKGSVPLPGPFCWSDGPVRILERNWLEIRAKVEVQVVAWLRRRLSLKGRAEVCAGYTFPFILYRLSVLPLPKDHRVALERSIFKLLWKGRSPLVRRQVRYQRPRDGGLGKPHLESHRLAERLAYISQSLTTDAVWSLNVWVACGWIPRLNAVVGQGMNHRSSSSAAGPFEIFCDLFRSRRAIQRVSGEFSFRSSGGAARLVDGGGSLPLELGPRFELLE